MKKLIKIGYYPFSGTGNSYTERMVDLLSQIGDVRPVTLNFRCLFLGRKDLAVINWTDNAFIGNNGKVYYFGIFKELIRCLLLRFFYRKIVFVRHNNFPHDTCKGQEGFLIKIVNLYSKLFHQRWIHSPQDGYPNHKYIPHPLYKLSNKVCDIGQWVDEDLDKYYIIFGRIKKYKKIENILSRWDSSMPKLLVIGPSDDSAYVDFLRGFGLDNVSICVCYLSESCSQALVRGSIALISTANDNDMIVSGSSIYAISMNANLIALHSCYLQSLKDIDLNNKIHLFSCYEDMVNFLKYFNSTSELDAEPLGGVYSDINIIKTIKNSLKEIM